LRLKVKVLGLPPQPGNPVLKLLGAALYTKARGKASRDR
jgi:hypothetical protein